MTPAAGLSLPLSVPSPLCAHEGRICPRFLPFTGFSHHSCFQGTCFSSFQGLMSIEMTFVVTFGASIIKHSQLTLFSSLFLTEPAYKNIIFWPMFPLYTCTSTFIPLNMHVTCSVLLTGSAGLMCLIFMCFHCCLSHTQTNTFLCFSF